MKKMFSILTAISLSIVLSAAAFAQDGTKTPVARKRQGNQQRRIARGVRSGELKKGEVKKLQKEQKEINQEKKEAKEDGVVTAEERKDIQKEQNQASRHIYRAKHNRRDRK
jgi:lipopolysaccharide export LptBFGC system permease protein LptF